MPTLGDILYTPEDKARLAAAKGMKEQFEVMKTIKDFKIWDGKQWINAAEGEKKIYHI